jgi:hypothetical protein
MVDRKVVPFDEFYYQLKLTHVFQKHPVYELSDSCLQFHTNTKYIHSKEQSFYYSPPILSFSLLSLLFLFSFIHLTAVFASYFSPFPSLPLSHFAACVRSSHCPTSPPAPSLFSFRPIPFLSLLAPNSESRHHFSLSHTLSPLAIVLRFSYSLSSLLLIRVFVPLPFYSPSPWTFSRRVIFFFSPSLRNFSLVSPLSHPI